MATRGGKGGVPKRCTNTEQTKVQSRRRARCITNRTRCNDRHGLRLKLETLTRGLPPPCYVLAITAPIPLSSRPYPPGTTGNEDGKGKSETGKRATEAKPRKKNLVGTTRRHVHTRGEGDAARENQTVARAKFQT